MSHSAPRGRGGRKPWGADDRARLAALYARGLSYVEIARQLGRTLGAIKQALYQDRPAALRRPGRGAHAGAGHQRRRPQASAAAAAVLDAFLRKPVGGGA